jgi:large conductance mechanosensitive channel
MFSGFRAFLFRGNVIDLAVAVVIGGAFGAVVTALVKDLITPFLGAIVGKPRFATLGFTINSSHFAVGDFLNSIVSFVLVAAAIYFGIIVPLQKLGALKKATTDQEPAVKECPYCCETVPAAATRCRACTSMLDTAGAT